MDKLWEIRKHIMLINDILLKEDKKEESKGEVYLVYVIDSNGCIDKESPKIFSKREDAFAYYKEYASEFISWYNKHHNIINDMKANMSYDDEEREFSISNSNKGNCSTHFEWSEAVLQKFFIS